MSLVDYSELDCKLFVGAVAGLETVEALLDAVSGMIGGTIYHRQVESGSLGVIVGDNDDADEGVDPDDPDAFLALPFLVEIYFSPPTPHAERVAAVSELVTTLRTRGSTVVAACDYEGELPD
jgi:hypothetical protein